MASLPRTVPLLAPRLLPSSITPCGRIVFTLGRRRILVADVVDGAFTIRQAARFGKCLFSFFDQPRILDQPLLIDRLWFAER